MKAMTSLIIGGDSTIGSALADALASQGDTVYATTRRASAAGKNTLHLDLATSDLNAVTLPPADIAFFCAAITGFAACRTNEPLARQVNVTGPILLARRLVAAGTRVVLLSTSAVFDWRVPNVAANRSPCPITVYGKLKAEAEKAFIAFGRAAPILRLTKVLTPADGLLISWIEALSQKRAVTAFVDHHMAPVTLKDVISALLAISCSSEHGVFQASGSRDISYLDAAVHLASRLGADPRLCVPARASESGIPPEEIIQYSSMDTSRIGAIAGWKAPDPHFVIDEVLRAGIDARKKHLGAANNV